MNVVCFKWTPPRAYRSQFAAEHVNTLYRMVRRHYAGLESFLCVTDCAEGLEPGVEAVPLWPDFATVPSPHGGHNPSCYRRLKLFDPAIASVLGRRFVSLDLDTVILRDLTPLWERPEDVVFWGDTNPRTHYNGSMMLLTAGARPQVWTDFDPAVSPRTAMSVGCFGSDQGWISYRLGKGEARWTREDGVYSFRNDLATNMRRVPANARVIFFHGNQDPWSPYIQTNCPWVITHWC